MPGRNAAREPARIARAIALAAICLHISGLSRAQTNDAAGQIAEALRAGSYSEALQMTSAALREQPRDVRVLTLKAIALGKLDRPRDSAAVFRTALAIDPHYVPALAGISQLEYRDGSEAAEQDLDELLRLRPQDETAHAMRATVAWNRHDCPHAVQHFSQASNVIASQPAALEEFASCLETLGEHNRAVETLRALAAAGNVNALKLSSLAYERLGNTPEAVSTLRRAILGAPDRADLYLDFASLCFDHHSFAVGVDMLNAGLTRLPGSAKLYLARGVMFAQMGKYEQADEDFNRAEALDPRETAGTDAQALAEFQADHLEAALAKVQEDIRRDPQNAFSRYLLAEILLRRGARPGSPEFSQALSAAQTAVRLRPAFTLAGDVLSRLYLESGDSRAAAAQCRATLAHDPSDQVAIYRLMRALRTGPSPAEKAELPVLAKRLAALRAEARKEEEQASRYQLSEDRQQAWK